MKAIINILAQILIITALVGTGLAVDRHLTSTEDLSASDIIAIDAIGEILESFNTESTDTIKVPTEKDNSFGARISYWYAFIKEN